MYNPKKIEKKWQKFWEENNTFKTFNPWEKGFDDSKEKFYVLDMFPYPSGDWLHVGHPEWYTANDILARYKKTKWFNVLHPMWWDAFWLPAENYAIKTWTHPKITTAKNIENFKSQIKNLGFSYDWEREIDTTNPDYYKWTQWIFLKMFEAGLAYEQDLPINYCPSCKTGLANEEVLNDFTCERCGTKVEKKKLRQWVLAITKYADRLLSDVDKLDWPESIKEMQRNWIGKSEGTEFTMKKWDKKNEACISKGVGLNCPAIASSGDIIYENIKKVKKKIKFYWNIEWTFTFKDKIINFNSKNIFKHFSSKNLKEFRYRRSLLATVFDQIDEFFFDKNNVWYFIFKNFVIKVVLWEQSNWNFFVKTYYVDDKKTKNYKNFLESEKNIPSISVYTTRIDTVFGMTYAVLAPDHPKVWDFITKEQKEVCEKYIENSLKKSDQDRTADNKEKTWVFTGSFLVNPFNNAEIPLWIWDYVLGNYGTWAVMAVPAHDSRDFEFAKKYNLEIIPTIYPKEIVEKYKEQADKKFFSNLSQKEADKHILETQKLEDIFFENLPFTEDWFIWNINYSAEKEEDFEKAWEIWEKYFTISSKKARKDFTKFAEENGFWSKKINFKLRDWLFSRQRYWWEPIPLIHLEKNDVKSLARIYSLDEKMEENKAYVLKTEKTENSDSRTLCSKSQEKSLVINWKIFWKIYSWIYSDIICDYDLPLKLPEINDFEPAWDGNSPLVKVSEFVNIKLAENLSWKRETNTMPQWWGSCWYHLRYMDPKNSKNLVWKEAEFYWDWVDSYVWWTEHAVLHLLYARFWHKFLFDLWIVKTDEPFHKLRNQGLILAHAFERKNGGLVSVDMVEEKDWKYFEKSTWEEVKKIISKMSKSLKNVVNPDDIVNEYWADSLRLYEMYMADFKDSAPWDTKWIIWVARFLEKSERLFSSQAKISSENDDFTMKLLHKTIKKIEEDIENYKFNTAIAALMILVNNWLPKDENLQKEWKSVFTRLLHPFAPHLAEELWEKIWEKESVFFSNWPKFDEKMTIDNEVKIWVQVMWKVRWEITIWIDEEKESVLNKAKTNEDVKKWIDWKEIVKEIYIPGKILNIVIK